MPKALLAEPFAARMSNMSPAGTMASIIKAMPTTRGLPHAIKASRTNPETMSRTPFRRSHQAMFVPSSGSGRPKPCVATLGLERYMTPIAMIPTATSSATPIENRCIRTSLLRRYII